MASAALKVLDETPGNLSLLRTTDLEDDGLPNVMKGPCNLYGIFVHNNGAGTPEAIALRLWDDTAPTVASDEPDFVFTVAAGAITFIPCQLPSGIPFANGLTIAAESVANGDVPDSPVIVELYAGPAS